MMDWKNLQYFLALAKAGSLSAAARQLQVEHATVGRRIHELEKELQLALVDRRGKSWNITPEGQQIATIAHRMELDTQAIGRIADSTRHGLKGTVTISAPPALATTLLIKPLAALHQRYPDLVIRILGEARNASLNDREADIAVRLTRPQKGDFIIQKLSDMTFNLYATSSYLKSTPQPDWRFIGYEGGGGTTPQQKKLEEYAAGRPFAFWASSLELQYAATREGAGIAALPDFMISEQDNLVSVETGDILLNREIWLVIHADLKNSILIRTITQRLHEFFKYNSIIQ